MVRLRRRSMDQGRALLLQKHPSARTAGAGQRSCSSVRGGGGRPSGGAAGPLGINSEQLEYLRTIASSSHSEDTSASISFKGKEQVVSTPEVQNISYKRSLSEFSTSMLSPDVDVDVSRRRASIGYDDGFNEAFAAYKEREKRRKSSAWRPEQIETHDSASTKKVIVVSILVTLPLLIIILLSIYLRGGSK